MISINVLLYMFVYMYGSGMYVRVRVGIYAGTMYVHDLKSSFQFNYNILRTVIDCCRM